MYFLVSFLILSYSLYVVPNSEATNYTFDSLELTDRTKKGIERLGFKNMTEIQAKAVSIKSTNL